MGVETSRCLVSGAPSESDDRAAVNVVGAVVAAVATAYGMSLEGYLGIGKTREWSCQVEECTPINLPYETMSFSSLCQVSMYIST